MMKTNVQIRMIRSGKSIVAVFQTNKNISKTKVLAIHLSAYSKKLSRKLLQGSKPVVIVKDRFRYRL